jgi:hypothetical protein
MAARVLPMPAKRSKGKAAAKPAKAKSGKKAAKARPAARKGARPAPGRGKAPAKRAASARPAPATAGRPGHAHCAATDPFGGPCQNVPRRPSAYCVIHSYLDR